jgi:hypothetical protein
LALEQMPASEYVEWMAYYELEAEDLEQERKKATKGAQAAQTAEAQAIEDARR